jgi:hypothetical protein
MTLERFSAVEVTLSPRQGLIMADRTLVVAIGSKRDEDLDFLQETIAQAIRFYMEDQEPQDWEPNTPPKFEDLTIRSTIGNWPPEHTVVTHRIEHSDEEE